MRRPSEHADCPPGTQILNCPAYYGVFSLLVVNAEAELMLCLPQRLQAQVTLGQQRLQALLCQAVHSSEEATEEEK